MAQRLCFKPFYGGSFVEEEMIDFKYYSGFSLSQKQKSIRSLHEEIKNKYPQCKVLEISSKSEIDLGVNLSAFNLKLYNREVNKKVSIESIFQSSKVFKNGGPYKDLLFKSSLDAKRDIRIRESGDLLHFDYCGMKWGLEPNTMFYDYIYISALVENYEIAEVLINFDCFTDIEFNHNKSINCQARAAAIFVSLKKQDKLNHYIKDLELFESIYDKRPNYIQESFLE